LLPRRRVTFLRTIMGFGQVRRARGTIRFFTSQTNKEGWRK
jgi:hypothetical protein